MSYITTVLVGASWGILAFLIMLVVSFWKSEADDEDDDTSETSSTRG